MARLCDYRHWRPVHCQFCGGVLWYSPVGLRSAFRPFRPLAEGHKDCCPTQRKGGWSVDHVVHNV